MLHVVQQRGTACWTRCNKLFKGFVYFADPSESWNWEGKEARTTETTEARGAEDCSSKRLITAGIWPEKARDNRYKWKAQNANHGWYLVGKACGKRGKLKAQNS